MEIEKNYSELSIEARALLKDAYNAHNSNNHVLCLELTQEISRVITEMRIEAMRTCIKEKVKL